jgi:hypothetical protein
MEIRARHRALAPVSTRSPRGAGHFKNARPENVSGAYSGLRCSAHLYFASAMRRLRLDEWLMKSNAAPLQASHCCLLGARTRRHRRKAPQQRAFLQQLCAAGVAELFASRARTSKNRSLEDSQAPGAGSRRAGKSKRRRLDEPENRRAGCAVQRCRVSARSRISRIIPSARETKLLSAQISSVQFRAALARRRSGATLHQIWQDSPDPGKRQTCARSFRVCVSGPDLEQLDSRLTRSFALDHSPALAGPASLVTASS